MKTGIDKWQQPAHDRKLRGWPKVSIVTPSLNQATFLEETICSVINQGYPNLEYIIIDGGSSDNSVDIIRAYENHLAYWESEKDTGQSEAINKGLRRVTGEIVAWINSDDTYTCDTFFKVSKIMMANPEVHVVCGDVKFFGSRIDEQIYYCSKPEFNRLLFHCRLRRVGGRDNHPAQPTVFWRREVMTSIGFLNHNLHRAMDTEYWLRMMLEGYQFHHIPQVLANYRFHSSSKSSKGFESFEPEWKIVEKNILKSISYAQRLEAYIWWYRELLRIKLFK